MSDQSDHDPTRPLSRFDLPRLVRVRESSAIFTPTEAIIERIHNGEVFYTEPHKLQFCNPSDKGHGRRTVAGTQDDG